MSPGTRLGLGAGILILIGLVVCLNLFCSAMQAYLETHMGPWRREWGDLALVGLVMLYALLLMIPFVPGVELGWAVMMWFGAEGTLAVYGATVLALAASFGIGRLVPISWIVRLLRLLRLHRAEQFALRLAATVPERRLGMLLETASGRSISFLLRHRYVLLAALFNLPGNWLIGGGGGIGMFAGLSGIYSFTAYVLLVALAVLPVPLIFLANHWFLAP